MSVIFAIFLFSVLIFVHELGHFTAAKLSGVQVNEFSMFMGPAIWKKQVGETLYAIRCIPIGGYCAMEGEDEETDDPRCFVKQRASPFLRQGGMVEAADYSGRRCGDELSHRRGTDGHCGTDGQCLPPRKADRRSRDCQL